MRTTKRLFTSEAVCVGHPDKLADQISDAILDDLLRQDPDSRVACETLLKGGLAIVAGEITTKAYVEIPAVVRRCISEVGYDDEAKGLDCATVGVLTMIEGQSPDIARGVRKGKRLGAGDQGIMFGYACRETEVLMPLPLMLARAICRMLAVARQEGLIKALRPDGKAQVTVEYEGQMPVRVGAVVVSAQHDPEIGLRDLREAILAKVVRRAIPAKLLDAMTRFHVNPTGRFVEGGPKADCGLTGRKIIVDSYGGAARHGGGAWSGKDSTKVDRSGAYMARYAAKNVVAAGLADRCEIQVGYAIGVSRPVSIAVESFGTGRIADSRLSNIVSRAFDFRPAAMIERLALRRPIFLQTARWGHFGIEDAARTWERTDMEGELRRLA